MKRFFIALIVLITATGLIAATSSGTDWQTKKENAIEIGDIWQEAVFDTTTTKPHSAIHQLLESNLAIMAYVKVTYYQNEQIIEQNQEIIRLLKKIAGEK